MKNETQIDLIIPPKAIVAEAHAVKRIMGKEISKNGTESEKMELNQSNIPINLGNSPLSPEWKKRITSLLNSMPDVFKWFGLWTH